jgi:hypothetical protein
MVIVVIEVVVVIVVNVILVMSGIVFDVGFTIMNNSCLNKIFRIYFYCC